jgi:hypothetical protein
MCAYISTLKDLVIWLSVSHIPRDTFMFMLGELIDPCLHD